jgi:hypothetical protein
MKRIYFDLDNPAFITWLKTRPPDAYFVLLGSDTPEDDIVDVVFAKVTSAGVELATWLIEKLQRGRCKVLSDQKHWPAVCLAKTNG